MLNYIITENTITVLIDNKPLIIDNTHKNFKKVEEAIKDNETEENIKKLIELSSAVVEFSNGNIEVKDGIIFYKGEVVNSSLSRRILSLMEQGFNISPFTNFMENLYKNPSFRAVNELYGFLEACNLPITEDGCFLAYKKVTKDYKDCYTETIDNSIGAKPEMPRYEVDDDKETTCSNGLHVASFSYMAHYSGERTVICKISPEDVVSVPVDYNNAKMRVCRYEVINEVQNNVEEIPEDVISDEDAYSNEVQDVQEEKRNFREKMLDYIGDCSNERRKNAINSALENFQIFDKYIDYFFILESPTSIVNLLENLAKNKEIKKNKFLKILGL